MEHISENIIEKAAGGDQEAFESIYRAFSKFVYNVAWRIVTRHEDAEEVTQEVFIIVYRKLNTFQFKSTLKTWVYRVTINTAMNYAKKLSKVKNKTTEYNEQIHCAGVLGDVETQMNKEQNEMRPRTRAPCAARAPESRAHRQMDTGCAHSGWLFTEWAT